MHYDWIIDVLADLKTFAQGNGLLALAEHLDDTSLVAATEIAQVVGADPGEAGQNAGYHRESDREFAASGNA